MTRSDGSLEQVSMALDESCDNSEDKLKQRQNINIPNLSRPTSQSRATFSNTSRSSLPKMRFLLISLAAILGLAACCNARRLERQFRVDKDSDLIGTNDDNYDEAEDDNWHISDDDNDDGEESNDEDNNDNDSNETVPPFIPIYRSVGDLQRSLNSLGPRRKADRSGEERLKLIKLPRTSGRAAQEPQNSNVPNEGRTLKHLLLMGNNNGCKQCGTGGSGGSGSSGGGFGGGGFYLLNISNPINVVNSNTNTANATAVPPPAEAATGTETRVGNYHRRERPIIVPFPLPSQSQTPVQLQRQVVASPQFPFPAQVLAFEIPDLAHLMPLLMQQQQQQLQAAGITQNGGVRGNAKRNRNRKRKQPNKSRNPFIAFANNMRGVKFL